MYCDTVKGVAVKVKLCLRRSGAPFTKTVACMDKSSSEALASVSAKCT